MFSVTFYFTFQQIEEGVNPTLINAFFSGALQIV